MAYNWQLADSPEFTYRITAQTDDALMAFSGETGYVPGMLQALPGNLQADTCARSCRWLLWIKLDDKVVVR